MTGELIERLERATGPDRELDAHVHVMLGPSGFEAEWQYTTFKESIASWVLRGEIVTACSNYEIPAYTGSIDASLTLVPEHFSCELTRVSDAPASDPGLKFTRCRLWDMRRSPKAIDPDNEWKSEGNRPLPLNVLGSKLIKSTIPGRRPSRRRPGSFAPIYRSGWQCV